MHRRGYRILHDLQEVITSTNHKLPYNLNEAVLGSPTEQRDRQNKPLSPGPLSPSEWGKGVFSAWCSVFFPSPLCGEGLIGEQSPR